MSKNINDDAILEIASLGIKQLNKELSDEERKKNKEKIDELLKQLGISFKEAMEKARTLLSRS